MKREVKHFFERKFSEVSCPRPRLDGVNFKQISKEENHMLIVQFGEQEIKKTIWECDSKKKKKNRIGWNSLQLLEELFGHIEERYSEIHF